MNEPAVEDEAVAGRAYHLHLVLQVVLVRSAPELVAAGHDPGCTVFAGEVVPHPKDVAHDARHQVRSRCLGLARIRACDRSGPHRLVIAAGRWDEPLVLVQRLRLAATANDDRQEILDTDLEHHMLEQAKLPGFKDKLTAGYRETLVEIENDFADTLKCDVEDTGFRVTHFDCGEYCDETDAFSQNPGDIISLKFKGLEITAEKSA